MALAVGLMLGDALCGCTNTKNTAMTRRIQALKANYNTYFNGHEAYLEGVKAQRDGNKDNYLEPLPLLITGNKATVNIGKSNFDRAIEKSQKAIKQHSITKRPQWNSNKPKTQKDREWLSQREYNPFLYKAWFLMADAQFRKGEYMEAASTYSYIQRLYFNKPNLVAQARVMEAKCFVEQNWMFEAEDIIARAQRDSFPEKLNSAKALVLADCALRDKKYGDAIPLVKEVAKKQHNNYEKARLYYLLGQLYHKTGEDKLAYKYFGKIFALNPPYELAFNARIQQTEVLSKDQSKKMIGKLRRMAKSSKNLNYLDQVYYAIGNIYMAREDTMAAIAAYKEGVEKSVRNGVEKGIVQLRLGQVYWDKEMFAEAKECYSSVIGLLDKEREDYKDIDERSKILDELYPSYSVVELQDSLIRLAEMDSVSRMKVIDQIIKDLKKKEKEEAARADAAKTQADRKSAADASRQAADQRNNRQSEGLWYFYNLTSVNAGKAEFKKRWGERKLTDHWRRKNITVLAEESDTTAMDSTQMDSLGNVGNVGNAENAGNIGNAGNVGNLEMADSTEVDTALSKAERRRLEKLAEYEADPHRPEYYLKDIPLTEEQMETSKAALVEGLYGSAVIVKDRMGNYPLAERLYFRVLNGWPEYEHRDDIYYNLFLLYARQGDMDKAEIYKQRLQDEFPEDKNLPKITDPNFMFKAKYGVAIEDSIYQKTYTDYVEGRYDSVVSNATFAIREYPEGANRARFMFLNTMSRLNMGDKNQFMAGMKEIVETYPQSTVSELAGLFVKGLQEGRLLASGVMNNGSIWDRRSGMLTGSDSISADTTFSDEKITDFVYVIAYEHDSIDSNILLFEMANYNFSRFNIRNFDINIIKGDGIDMCQVSGFASFDEAFIYYHQIRNDAHMAELLEGLKIFIISKENLDRIGRVKSYADYFDYYEETFGDTGEPATDENYLDEPSEFPNAEDIPDEELNGEEEEEYDPELDEDNFIF